MALQDISKNRKLARAKVINVSNHITLALSLMDDAFNYDPETSQISMVHLSNDGYNALKTIASELEKIKEKIERELNNNYTLGK